VANARLCISLTGHERPPVILVHDSPEPLRSSTLTLAIYESYYIYVRVGANLGAVI